MFGEDKFGKTTENSIEVFLNDEEDSLKTQDITHTVEDEILEEDISN